VEMAASGLYSYRISSEPENGADCCSLDRYFSSGDVVLGGEDCSSRLFSACNERETEIDQIPPHQLLPEKSGFYECQSASGGIEGTDSPKLSIPYSLPEHKWNPVSPSSCCSSSTRTNSSPDSSSSRSKKRRGKQTNNAKGRRTTKKRKQGKDKRDSGLWTTVHGSAICGYVCLAKGRRLGRPCSQYVTSGAKYCKRHQKFQKELEAELEELNSNSSDPIDYEKKYCICNDTYQDGDFMIQCDDCDDWYHGECVGITEEEAENISQYTCDLCRRL